MKYIYVITVRPKYGGARVSSEGYTSLEAAQAFIENRGDCPEKVNHFHYKGRQYTYLIHEVKVC